MRALVTILLVACVAVLAYAHVPTGWDIDAARTALKLDVQTDKIGNIVGIEYQIPPADVPQPIRTKMNLLHPGGPFTGAMKVYPGGVLHYELSRVVGGRAVEALFTEQAVLQAKEIEVAEADVPQAVKDVIALKFPTGTVDKWEEIWDATQIVQYHVKLTELGRKYKVAVTPQGAIEDIWFEIPAELEVPAPPR